MKVDIKSLWDSNKRKPNVYLVFRPENDTERALMLSIYGVRPKFLMQTSGEHMIDFYPDGEKR